MYYAGFLLVGAAWATAPVPEQPDLQHLSRPSCNII